MHRPGTAEAMLQGFKAVPGASAVASNAMRDASSGMAMAMTGAVAEEDRDA